MFYAHSFRKDDTICADKVTDTSEIFSCLNEDCDAQFKVRGVNSNRTVHFAKCRGSDHIDGCPYIYASGQYKENGCFIKHDLLSIFNSSSISRKNVRRNPGQSREPDDKENKKYVRTPKQLLDYCLSNKLDTEYIDNITVNDVIVDIRNISNCENYKGVSGLKLLLGQTFRYDKEESSLVFKIKKRTDNGVEMCLTAKIFVSPQQLREINAHLFDRYGNFAGHPIAVLGDWKTENECNVITTVENPRNVIYRFTTQNINN